MRKIEKQQSGERGSWKKDRQKLVDGEKEIAENEQKLKDAKQDLTDGERDL